MLSRNFLLFLGVSSYVDSVIPLYGFTIPSDFAQTSALHSIEALTALYIEHMKRTQPRGPYRLAGYSLGCGLAYEMASQLLGAGETVEYLGLIDGSRFGQPYLDDDAVLSQEVVEHLDMSRGVERQYHRVHDAGLRWFIDAIKTELRITTEMPLITPAQLQAHQKKYAVLYPGRDYDEGALTTLVAYLNNAHALSVISLRQRTTQPIDIPVQLFTSEFTRTNSPESSKVSDTVADDWRELMTDLQHQVIGGDHNTIMTEPLVNELANRIVAALDFQVKAIGKSQ